MSDSSEKNIFLHKLVCIQYYDVLLTVTVQQYTDIKVDFCTCYGRLNLRDTAQQGTGSRLRGLGSTFWVDEDILGNASNG